MWTQVASVELPLGMQTADTTGVIDQVEMQFKAVLHREPHRDERVPHVEALAPVVARAYERLLARRDALRAKESRRRPPVTEEAGPNRDDASENLDDARRALESVLASGTKLTDGKSSAPASPPPA
jgi:hypothetical protein